MFAAQDTLISLRHVEYKAQIKQSRTWIPPLSTTRTSSASADSINSMTTNKFTVTNQSCEESLQLHISETVPNSTASNFHGCSSIITHVQSWTVVDESPEETSDRPEIKEDSQIEETEGAGDITANDDDSTVHRTNQFYNCHVYINSFNARGVKVKNSGNYAPRVTHHGITTPNEGPSSSSKLSRPELSIRLSTRSILRKDGSSYASESVDSPSAPPIGIDVPLPTFESDSTLGPPPTLFFHLREDISSFPSDGSPSTPPVGINVPFSTFEQKQRTKRDKLPATVDDRSMQSNPATTTLPGLESQPHPINPFLPMHMGLPPDFLSHILQPFPDDAPNNNKANDWDDFPSSTNLIPHQYPATPSSSQHRPDTNSNSLEHHLDSALAILIQTSGLLTDGVSPQARNTLRAINALVSMETPTYNPPPLKSVRKVAKWLQIPRYPK